MSKTHFSDLLGRKKSTEKKPTKQVPADLENMLSSAKVRSNTPPPNQPKLALDPNARRGKRYKNAEGQTVNLDGKVQEIPLNAYEVDLLERAAKQAGLTLTTYIRSLAIRDARKLMEIDPVS